MDDTVQGDGSVAQLLSLVELNPAYEALLFISVLCKYVSENMETVIICGWWMHCRRRWAEVLLAGDVWDLSTNGLDELQEAKKHCG